MPHYIPCNNGKIPGPLGDYVPVKRPTSKTYHLRHGETYECLCGEQGTVDAEIPVTAERIPLCAYCYARAWRLYGRSK